VRQASDYNICRHSAPPVRSWHCRGTVPQIGRGEANCHM
jgi:hypothetical protein